MVFSIHDKSPPLTRKIKTESPKMGNDMYRSVHHDDIGLFVFVFIRFERGKTVCVPAHRIYDLKFRIEVGRFRAQGAAKLRQRGSSSRKENEKQFSILLENKGKATTKLNNMKKKRRTAMIMITVTVAISFFSCCCVLYFAWMSCVIEIRCLKQTTHKKKGEVLAITAKKQ